METGRPVRIGPITFHFTALNLLLWGLGLGFLLQVLLAGGLRRPEGGLLSLGGLGTDVIWASGSDGPGAVFRNGEVWRLVSAMFIHTSLLHFFINAWALYQLGRITEHIYGSARFLLTYLVTGLAGCLASAAWFQFREGHAVAAGASGAICGLLGLLLAHMRGRRDAAAEWYGRQLLQNAILILAMGFAIPHIDNAAHLGGFAAGYLLAHVFETAHFLHLGRRRQQRLVQGITWVCALAAAACLTIAAAGAKERLHYVRSANTLASQLNDAARDMEASGAGAAKLQSLRADIEAVPAPEDLATVRERALRVLEREEESAEVRAAALKELAQVALGRAFSRAPDLYVVRSTRPG